MKSQDFIFQLMHEFLGDGGIFVMQVCEGACACVCTFMHLYRGDAGVCMCV